MAGSNKKHDLKIGDRVRFSKSAIRNAADPTADFLPKWRGTVVGFRGSKSGTVIYRSDEGKVSDVTYKQVDKTDPAELAPPEVQEASTENPISLAEKTNAQAERNRGGGWDEKKHPRQVRGTSVGGQFKGSGLSSKTLRSYVRKAIKSKTGLLNLRIPQDPTHKSGKDANRKIRTRTEGLRAARIKLGVNVTRTPRSRT